MRNTAILAATAAFSIGISALVHGSDMNYGKALQMSNYFFECQESGTLSPGNRCPWRGPAHTRDGEDVGLDLSGGWYDAGDHWKSNNTMAQSALMLAWGAVEFPEAYEQTGQTDELLNNLRYICDYFLKCVVDAAPDDTTDFNSYEVYVDVGGKPGPAPGVHSVWASPEVIEGYTVREALKATNTYPAADVEPLMAAALTASAMVFDQLGSADDAEYVEKLMKTSRKLCLHTDTYFENFFSNTVSEGVCLAVDPSGTARAISYRDTDPYASCIMGFTWLHNAEEAFNGSDYDGRFGALAADYEQKMHDAGGNHYKWWWATSPKYAMFALLTSGVSLTPAATARMEEAVTGMIDVWVETNPSDPNGVVISPGGLHYRKNAKNTFTISRMLQASALAIFDAKRRPSKKDALYSYLKSQVDYVLGNNPLNKSYMIGFDNDGTGEYLTVVHHRGAYGAWQTFEHFVGSKPFYRPNSVRHTLHGGVLMGNNAPEDSFKGEVMNHYHCEVAIYTNARFQAVLAGLIADGMGEGEAADDNSFPPEEERDESTDMYTTDREFFVVAKIKEDKPSNTKFEVDLHNRTRWPARRTGGMSFRYYFTPDGDAAPGDYTANIGSSNVNAEISGPIIRDDCDPYVEVTFPDDTIGPFVSGNCTEWCNHHEVIFRIMAPNDASWDLSNDWSSEGLSGEDALLPRFAVYQDGELVGGEAPECDVVHSEHQSSYGSMLSRRTNVRALERGIVVTGAQPDSRVEIYGLDGRLYERGIVDELGGFVSSKSASRGKGAVVVRYSDERGRRDAATTLVR